MSSTQELRDEIRRTRAELGETVEALAGKVDVRARAGHAVRRVRRYPVEWALAGVSAILGVTALVMGWRERRR